MYPINHYHPLRPLLTPSSLHPSLKVSPVRLTECLRPFFSCGIISPSPAPCSGDGLRSSVRVCRPLDLRGAEWEVSVWAPYQTGQLARLNQMRLRRLRLALSVREARPRREASDVNNGGAGGSPESGGLQTRSRPFNAPALITLHLWERVRPVRRVFSSRLL